MNRKHKFKKRNLVKVISNDPKYPSLDKYVGHIGFVTAGQISEIDRTRIVYDVKFPFLDLDENEDPEDILFWEEELEKVNPDE